jgi:hypothetical protein
MSAQPSRPRFRPAPEDIQPMTEEMLQQERDHNWVLRDPEKLKLYAGQIVAVCRETVWGAGRDPASVMASATAALEKAAGTPGIPSIDDLSFVVVTDWFTEETSGPVH